MVNAVLLLIGVFLCAHSINGEGITKANQDFSNNEDKRLHLGNYCLQHLTVEHEDLGVVAALPCNNNENQKWEYNEGLLQNKENNYCLLVPMKFNKNDGISIRADPYCNGDEFIWDKDIGTGKSYYLKNKASGKCLTVSRLYTKSMLIQTECLNVPKSQPKSVEL